MSVTAAPDAEKEAPPFEMKRMGRHTLVYGLGLLLSNVVSFIMLPIYTRYLTPADYGVMELIEMTLDVIAIAAGARIAVGVFRFYHKMETQAEKEAVVSTSLMILAMSYGSVALLTVLVAPFLSELIFQDSVHAGLIRLAAASLGFQSLIIAPLAYIRIKDRSTLFVMASAAKLAIALTLNIVLLVGMGMGVEGVFISSLCANIVVGLWLTTYLIREVGFAFSRAATRDLIRYGVPLMFTQFATFVATFGDRYFLQHAADVSTVGIYSLAYKFGFLLAILGYTPFASFWESARFEVAKRDDRDEIYARVFILMNVLLWTVAVGLALFGSDLIRIMANPSFHAAGSLIPLILLAYVLQSWTYFQELGIHVSEKTAYLTLGNWIGAVVALAGYWLLIPRFLGFGAAVATIFAFAVRHLVVYTISQWLWPVRYDWGPIVRLSLLACGIGLVGAFLPQSIPLTASVPLRTLLFALFLVLVWRSEILASDDREKIDHLARTGLARLMPRTFGRATL